MEVRITEKQVREIEVTKESYTLCDKCDSRIIKRIYDAFDCEICITTGECYPEGNNIMVSNVDLCQKCSDDLVILLKNNGYRINTKEVY